MAPLKPRPTQRLGWKIKPVSHPHSTKKGAKGYDRRKTKEAGINEQTPDSVHTLP